MTPRERKRVRALELVAAAAHAFRSATCGAVDKLSARGEVAYDDAAAGLDGALNALAELDGRKSGIPVVGQRAHPRRSRSTSKLDMGLARDGLTYTYRIVNMPLAHILAPGREPLRTVCGLAVSRGEKWGFRNFSAKICASCERMRSSALDNLRVIKERRA